MDSETREFRPDVIDLPTGYPVYCIYVPSGFDEEFEMKLIEELKKWGNNLGKNIFVATWDIKDPSYITFSKQIKLEARPALILTDSNKPNEQSLLIKITDLKTLTDIEGLKIILNNISQLILIDEKKEALKKFMLDKKQKEIQNLIKDILKQVNIKFKFSISLGLFSFSFENK
ncbi:MAG TPA: hypothetical protein VKU94_03935 [Geobacterales bacterium]|nr:hypothetical protein [Geobacterales bacterium]